MWEINNASQIITFFYSLVLGIFFSIFYDVLRAFRIIKQHSKLLVFIEDILYFSFNSIITFIFLIATTNGEVRAYVIIGLILGFILFFITLSKYFLKIICWIFSIIKIFFMYINSKFYYFSESILNFFKNTLKCLKKVLKSIGELLYTNRN